MTREEIIRMAHEAGTAFVAQYGVASATPEWLERFATLVAAAEREACSKVCDELVSPSRSHGNPGRAWVAGTLDCAAAIRARGDL